MKSLLELSADSSPIDAEKARELFGDCRTYFYKKVKEIEEQVERGRYNRYAVLNDGKVRVNYFVYYDYCVNRKMLMNKNAAKYAPPFEPKLIADITPVSVVHHIA